MKSFHQFWNKINGPMYKNVPPPIRYEMEKMPYVPDDKLKTITHDDTASYAAEDVVGWYEKYGKNTTILGKPMSDLEFKKFFGQTWHT